MRRRKGKKGKLVGKVVKVRCESGMLGMRMSISRKRMRKCVLGRKDEKKKKKTLESQFTM